MKNILPLIFALFVYTCYSQEISSNSTSNIPPGYYNNAQGLSGYNLKTALYNIISTSHTPQLYSQIWGFFQTADVKPNNTVWEIYTNCNFLFSQQDTGSGGTNECEFFNREHLFPRSWFGGNIEPMRSDVHHIFPSDKKVNNSRGNIPFATVATPTSTTSNGTKFGNSSTSGISGTVIEPIDELKGDIARAYFYMATRYENLIATWQNLSTDGAKVLNGTSSQAYQNWAVNMLYQWHLNDPVSQKEIDRNNKTYNYQSNRNPFIDNPQWVFSIWSSALQNEEVDFKNEISVFPNPVTDQTVYISSNISIDGIQLYNLNGQLIQEIKTPLFQDNVYTVNNLPKGFYFIKLSTDNKSLTKKIIVN